MIHRSRIAGLYDSPTFNFLRNLPTAFHSDCTKFTFPPTVHKSSLFSTSLTTFVILCLFDDSHSDRCEVISYCGFDLHFSIMITDVEWLFMYMLACTCWPSICLLWKNTYSDFLPIFYLDCLFFCYWVACVLYIFWLLTPY